MKFEQFLDIVNKKYYENEFELRYGQIIMNILYDVWPKKYQDITTAHTDLDCFYNDKTAKFTLDYLEKEWNDKNI